MLGAATVAQIAEKRRANNRGSKHSPRTKSGNEETRTTHECWCLVRTCTLALPSVGMRRGKTIVGNQRHRPRGNFRDASTGTRLPCKHSRPLDIHCCRVLEEESRSRSSSVLSQRETPFTCSQVSHDSQWGQRLEPANQVKNVVIFVTYSTSSSPISPSVNMFPVLARAVSNKGTTLLAHSSHHKQTLHVVLVELEVFFIET